MCCVGEFDAFGFKSPACVCQPRGTIALAPGVSTTLTVSGSTCNSTYTYDAGHRRSPGTVAIVVAAPGQLADASGALPDGAGLPMDFTDAAAMGSPKGCGGIGSGAAADATEGTPTLRECGWRLTGGWKRAPYSGAPLGSSARFRGRRRAPQ